MAKQMPKADEGNPNEWLNTYADMVTLLLTFFVLLFACSNMDETKMQYIFQAFQMRGKYINSSVDKPNSDPNVTETLGSANEPGEVAGGEGEMPQSFDQLYQYLSEYIETNELGESVSISQGPAHITIRFDDGVMFDGDSWTLKDEGRGLLMKFIPAIRAVNPSVQSMTVSGHTAKVAFPIVNDYLLSSMRAVSVQNFLEFNNAVDNSKYIVTGYGPNRPLETNDTEAGRAENRRVELLLLRAENELDLNEPEIIKDILNQYGITSDEFDRDKEPTPPDVLPDGAAEKIVSGIVGRFDNVASNDTGFGPGTTDGSEFFASDDSQSGSE